MQEISPVKSIALFPREIASFGAFQAVAERRGFKKPHAYFSLTKVHGRMQFLGVVKSGLADASIRTLLLLKPLRQSRLPQSGGGVLEFS